MDCLERSAKQGKQTRMSFILWAKNQTTLAQSVEYGNAQPYPLDSLKMCVTYHIWRKKSSVCLWTLPRHRDENHLDVLACSKPKTDDFSIRTVAEIFMYSLSLDYVFQNSTDHLISN